MKAQVYTEILDHSILGVKISNLNTPRNLIEYVVSIHAGSADIDGGTIDGVAIGANSRASSVYTSLLNSSGNIEIKDGASNYRAILTNAGTFGLWDSSASLRFFLNSASTSYFNPSGKMAFGATSVTTGAAKFEFALAASFLGKIYAIGDIELTSSASSYTYGVGEIMDQFTKIYDQGGGSTWDSWNTLSLIDPDAAQSLANMNGINIGSSQWGYVSYINQPLHTLATNRFYDTTITTRLTTNDLTEGSGALVGNMNFGKINFNDINPGPSIAGSFRYVSKEYDPVTALVSPIGNTRDVRTYDLWLTIDKRDNNPVLVSDAIKLNIDTLLGHDFVSDNDEYYYIDLIGKQRLPDETPAVAVKYRFQFMIARQTTPTVFMVDESGGPYTLDPYGSFYSTGAATGSNTEVDIFFHTDTTAAGKPLVIQVVAASYSKPWIVELTGRVQVIDS